MIPIKTDRGQQSNRLLLLTAAVAACLVCRACSGPAVSNIFPPCSSFLPIHEMLSWSVKSLYPCSSPENTNSNQPTTRFFYFCSFRFTHSLVIRGLQQLGMPKKCGYKTLCRRDVYRGPVLFGTGF